MSASYVSIVQTINRYGYHFDGGTAELVGECFTADGEIARPDGVVKGRAAIAADLANRRGGARYQDGARPVHIYTNIVIVAETGGAATVLTNWTLYMVDAEGVAKFTALGLYEDEFAMDEGVWRIRRRQQRGLGRA